MAASKGLVLRIRPSVARVESDSILLERILLNLINNAIAYTPEGGRILVACRKRGDWLRIEVRDNGIGIRPENQQYIFREFFQLGNEERRRDKGLGLGLAIVDRLSKLLNHPISLHSASGQGSVFAVDVPLAHGVQLPETSEPPAAVGQERSASHAVPLKGARVLVVDDDDLVLSGTRGLLDSWGCQAQEATSVAGARKLLDDASFDLLICDYRLADGAGLEVIHNAERIRGEYVPSILISGDTGPEVLRKVSAEKRHLLHKPVSAAKLRSLALFLLAGNR
jgi:two-component system, sensor histidine kinase